MPVSDAKKASNRKWDAENMAVMCCRVRKTYADAVKEKAAREGTTVNAILKAALDDFLGDDKPN